MRRLVGLLMALAVVTGACVVSSESSGPAEPIISNAVATTEVGALAVSDAVIDPLTCSGVLVPISGELSMELQSLTETVSAAQPELETMCSAIYDTGLVDGEFLAVVLMQFKSDDSAVDHYELMKDTFVASDFAMSEVNSSDEGLIDQVSALIDSEGIGRTSVFRQREWLVTVTAGPTMAQSLWNVGDMEAIGRGVLGRVK